MGGNLLGDLVQEEVPAARAARGGRRRGGADRAVRLAAARTSSCSPRAARAPGSRTTARSAPRLLHDALRRLRAPPRRLAAAQPLDPHGAARRGPLLLADRHPPPPHAARRARARHRAAPVRRRAGAAPPPSCATSRCARWSSACRSASVTVDGEEVGAIGPGLLVLLGITHDDGAARADQLADKVRALRIFPDADGRMNEPLGDRAVLCISQFTLYGDARKGNRPSYVAAARPEHAEPLYERFCERLGARARACSARIWRSRSSTTGRSRCCWSLRRSASAHASRRALRLPLRRRAAAGGAAARRLGDRPCRPSSSPPACASTPRARSSASAGDLRLFPDRTLERAHVRAR